MNSAIVGDPRVNVSALETATDPWRALLIGGLAAGFTIPYFHGANALEVCGQERLRSLPRQRVLFLANHQTHFLEAMAFYHAVYVLERMDVNAPLLRFSAAAETMTGGILPRLFARAGCVPIRRSFREGTKDVQRDVDMAAVASLERAIDEGWLLHFPSGTTRPNAPIRRGIAHIVHETNPIVVPVRVDGFRELLAAGQMPGRVGRRCRVDIRAPLDTRDFVAGPATAAAIDSFIESLAWAMAPLPG